MTTRRMCVLWLVGCVAAPAAMAITPTSMPMHGVLRDNAGTVVQQGEFAMVFTLYDAENVGNALWTESWPAVTVENGTFSVVLGSLNPISPVVFVGISEAWLGMSVEGEPELPRRPMGADAFAFVAGHAATADTASVADVALSLNCTACIPQEALDFVLPGTDASSLPFDGLDEVSNGVLTTTFDTTHNSTDTPVPNDTLTGLIESTIVVPDLGVVQQFGVALTLTHPDVSEVTITLRAPSGAEFVLHDKTLPGQADLNLSLTHTDPIANGTLTDILNTPSTGGWKLTIEDLVVGNEGTLDAWSLSFTAVSGVKAQVNGDLLINGNLDLQANQLKFSRFHVSAGPPVPCTDDVLGLFYLDLLDKLVKVCVDGEFQAINNVCGDGLVSASEECDDGNNATGDGCNAGCGIEAGFACQGNPSVCDPVCGDGVKTGNEACDDGNTTDCDGCSSTCEITPNTTYKGVCLAPVKYGNSNPPGPPAGCTPFQHGQNWNQNDFTTLCTQFSASLGMSAACSSIDTDANGGNCSNSNELLVFDNDSSVDVWVHSGSWSFNPQGSSKCNQQFGGQHIAVYACQ